MQDYQKRLIVEYFELSDRIEKLSNIVAGYDDSDIAYVTKKDLLVLQLTTMKKYQFILQTRMLLEGLAKYLEGLEND